MKSPGEIEKMESRVKTERERLVSNNRGSKPKWPLLGARIFERRKM